MCWQHDIITIDDIIASDNIAALALKALLKYNQISTIEIKNIYVYILKISKRGHIGSCNERKDDKYIGCT